MRPWNFGALLLLTTLALGSPPPATAQAPEARGDLGANAAMKYWQAFGLLPNLDASQEKLLHEWNKAPLDAAAQALIDKSQGSREYLQRGAKLQRCDWSLDYEDGIRLRLPYLPKSLTLARLTALHARREFEQGRWESGWEDTTALLKLGRHVEVGPTFIQNLVGYMIESMAVDAASPYLPKLKSVFPQAAPAVLEGLPAGPTLSQVVLLEKEISGAWMIRELQKAEKQKEGSWRAAWDDLLEAIVFGNEGAANVDRNAVPPVKTYSQAVKMLEDLLPAYDELAKLSALPWKDFDARYSEFVQKWNAASPLARFVLPNMNQIVPAERRNRTRLAQFAAAIAIVQGGPDQLKTVKDPASDGPFEFRPLGQGFELKSKLIFKGQPVTLTVGKDG